MEAIAQLFRVLANGTRIRIIRVLVALDELSVQDIASAVPLLECKTSDHLRSLSSAGIVWRRRSGRRVYYTLARTPGNAVTAAVASFFAAAFRDLRGLNPEQIARHVRSGRGVYSDDVFIKFFTSFTHPRRLQILRHLSVHGRTPAASLPDELSMSPQACARHLSKLSRRNCVSVERMGRHSLYSVCVELDADRRAVMDAVLEQLRRGTTDLTPP
jgi:DNA-binding transcriptional ArsR family regulator